MRKLEQHENTSDAGAVTGTITLYDDDGQLRIKVDRPNVTGMSEPISLDALARFARAGADHARALVARHQAVSDDDQAAEEAT